MKKILAMLLALILVVSMLPVATFAAEEDRCQYATDGQHKWQNGKCVNSIGSYWNTQTCNAQCTHEEYINGECTRCDVTCSHSKSNGWWGSESTFVNGVCSQCDYACPHTRYNSWDNKCSTCGMTKPTCTNHEYEDGVCTKCGDTCRHPESKVLPAVEPTCITAGKTAGSQCKICDKITTAQHTRPATGEHKYTEFVGYKDGEEPTCTTPGVKIYKCATCTDTDEVNVTAEHKEKILSKQEATCSQEGYIFYTCEECHKDWHDTFEKLPHTEQPLPSKAATCNETGLTAGKKCSVCQEVLVKQVVLAKLEHVWRDVSAKAATCTANGNNAYKECNLCHATLNKEIIPAAHDFSQNPNKCAKCGARNPGCQHTNASITTTKEATCKATGTQTFKCNDCGDTYVETLPKLDYHNYVNGTCTWCQKEACSHNYTTVTAEATCTEKGYTKTYCTICGKVSSERSQNALGHNWNNDVVHNFCTRCGVANPNAVATDKLTGDLQDIFTLG